MGMLLSTICEKKPGKARLKSSGFLPFRTLCVKRTNNTPNLFSCSFATTATAATTCTACNPRYRSRLKATGPAIYASASFTAANKNPTKKPPETNFATSTSETRSVSCVMDFLKRNAFCVSRIFCLFLLVYCKFMRINIAFPA